MRYSKQTRENTSKTENKQSGPETHKSLKTKRVGGRLALFCIHRVNQVYGALVVTSRTCYDVVVSLLLLFTI